MCAVLKSSSHSSKEESTAPSSLPTPEPPAVDMKNPWGPPFGGALLTQDEVYRRWALFTNNQRYHFQTMSKRYAEIKRDVPAEAEVILSTSGEMMYVKKVLNSKLFRNWSWDSASSRWWKASSTRENTSSSDDSEDTYDEDEDEDEDEDKAYKMIQPMAFREKRDSIEVHRQSFGRRSSAEEYYRCCEDEDSRGSLVEGIRRMKERLISAVQSRCASPQDSEHNSPDNSDSDKDEGDSDGKEPSAPESPKTKSKLMTLVQRSLPRSQKGRSQNQQRHLKPKPKPKHEPCHRSRLPNAPLLKNANEPGPVAPVWSDRIGPKNERVEDLCACLRDLSTEAESDGANNNDNKNTAGRTCIDPRKSIEPGFWLSGHC